MLLRNEGSPDSHQSSASAGWRIGEEDRVWGMVFVRGVGEEEEEGGTDGA